MHHVDMIVLGGGSAGLAAAQRAALHGARVALFDPAPLGGTCVHAGCVPKKAMWLAAHLAQRGRAAAALGFERDVGALDWPAFVARRQRYIEAIAQGYAEKLAAAGIVHVAQRGRFIDASSLGTHTVRADDGTPWRAPHVVIATGARPLRPAMPDGAHATAHDAISDDVFRWKTLPRRLAIVGGGYVAVEFAGMLRALGSEVTMFVRGARLLDGFDEELTDALAAQYRAMGVDLRFDTEVRGADFEGFDAALWAIGRVPNTEALALDAIGVGTDSRGHVIVDDAQRTTVEGVWAVGDVTAQPALTPVAVAAGRRLADRLFGGRSPPPIDPLRVPSVVFSQPPLGRVGLTEAQARALHGDAVTVRRAAFRPMLSALTDSPQRSVFKVICVGDEQRIVGLHLLGEAADEMLQGFALAIGRGLTAEELDEAIAIHPTSAEEVLFAR